MRSRSGRKSIAQSAPALIESLEERRLLSAVVGQLANSTVGVGAEFESVDHSSGPLGTVTDISVSAWRQTVTDNGSTTSDQFLSLFIQVIDRDHHQKLLEAQADTSDFSL